MKRASESENEALTKKTKTSEPQSHFEYILSNPGLQHITESILANLDIQTAGKCRRVCQDFKALVDNQKAWHIQRIQWIMNFLYRKYHDKIKEVFQMDDTDFTLKCLMLTSEVKAWQKFMATFDSKKPIVDLKIVADLLSNYLAKKECFGTSPFYFAVKFNHIDFVKLVINRSHINFYELDIDKNTPIHQACIQGHQAVLSLILDEFENHDFQGQEQEHYLARLDDVDMNVKTYNPFIHGPLWNPNQESDDSDGDDDSDESDSEEYEENSDSGSDVEFDEELAIRRDETFLDKAAQRLCSIRKLGIDRLLSSKTNKAGNTPAHEAIENGHIDIVKLLLDSKVGRKWSYFDWMVKARNSKNELIHHKACALGNLELVEKLGAQGCQGFVEIDDNDMAPLQIAFKHGHIEVVKSIIVSAKNYKERNIVDGISGPSSMNIRSRRERPLKTAANTCRSISEQVLWTSDQDLIKFLNSE